jgi:hypothetical protein
MAILYYKDPADGLYYPIIGSDIDINAFVAKIGDVMTGDLAIDKEADTAEFRVATTGNQLRLYLDRLTDRSYLVAEDAAGLVRKYLQVQADPFEVQADPTTDLGVATKQYVDNVAGVGAPIPFTPVITQNGAVVPNSAVYRAVYTRVGNMVTFEMAVTAGESTGTGTIFIKPPVQYVTPSGSGWSIGQGGCQIGTNHPVNVYRQPAAPTDFYLYKSADANSSVLTEQLSNSTIRIGGTYLVE